MAKPPHVPTLVPPGLDPATVAEVEPLYGDRPLVPQEGDIVEETQSDSFYGGDDSSDAGMAPVDPSPLSELIMLSGQLAVEFGPVNQFTEARMARFRQDTDELERDIELLDAQIMHLNARRANAIRAVDSLLAALKSLGETD